MRREISKFSSEKGITAGLCGHPNQFSRWTIHWMCVCVCVCFAHCKISWYVQQPLNWLNTIMYLSICLFTFFSSPLFHHFLSFFLFIIIVIIIIIIIIPHYYILCLVASIVQCLWLSFFSFFFLAQKDTVFVQSSRVYYAACQTCNLHVPLVRFFHSGYNP